MILLCGVLTVLQSRSVGEGDDFYSEGGHAASAHLTWGRYGGTLPSGGSACKLPGSLQPSAVLMLWTQVQFQLPKGFAAMSDAWNKWQLTFSLRAELRILHLVISRRQTQFSWVLFFLDIWRKLSHYLGEIVTPISGCGPWFKCC